MCWEYLKFIVSELMLYRNDLEVGLLIGINCLRVIKSREIIFGFDNDLYGVRIVFGWGIIGRVCFFFLFDLYENYDVWINKIIIRELISIDECVRFRYGVIFVLKFCVKEVFNFV